MRIAVNTRFLLSHKMEGFGWYTYEIVKRLVENHPEHEFIFFFDRKYDDKFIFGDNVEPVILSPQARHPILFYIWFEFSVRKALKKYNADIFLSPDGYLSLKSDVKQISVIHDINFEHNPKDVPWLMRKYLCRYFKLFARKAQHIITVSHYSKKDICSTYMINESNVSAIWNGASDEFKPVEPSIQVEIRNKFSDGCPFFLFVGAIHPRKNVNRLIRAFEKYKKANPQSTHKLVIVGEKLFAQSKLSTTITESIEKDLLFTGHLNIKDLALLMGSAEIFTFIPYFEGFGIPLVEAMKCATPILAGDKTSLPEVAGDAAIYCDPFNVDDIFLKLNELSSNESLRIELGQKGLIRSQLFSWDSAAEKVWEVIEKVENKTNRASNE